MSRRPVRFEDTNAYKILVEGCLPVVIVLGLIIAAVVVVVILIF